MTDKYKILTLILIFVIAAETFGFIGISEARNANEIDSPPEGFEVVPLTSDGQQDLKFTAGIDINNCGEVAWDRSDGFFDQGISSEIFFYDNGEVERITDNFDRDAHPRINDLGDIVWGKATGGNMTFDRIIYYSDGEENLVAMNPQGIPTNGEINNEGHITWAEYNGEYSCEYRNTRLMFYDGNEIKTLIDGEPYSYQSIALNDDDELTYTRYNWCDPVYVWVGDIFYHNYNTGEIIDITSPLYEGTHQHQLSDINSEGDVVFNMNLFGDDIIAFWDKSTGEVEEITDGSFEGQTYSLNDYGDFSFWRWVENSDEMGFQTWMYFKHKFYKLTPTSRFNYPYGINNYGEIAIMYDEGAGYNDPYYNDIWFMRWKRTGDMDQDLDVDAEDFNQFKSCYTGDVENLRLCNYGQNCRFADINHDNKVGCDDWTIFKENWNGPGRAPLYARCDLQSVGNPTKAELR